jgi:hypothetical protein
MANINTFTSKFKMQNFFLKNKDLSAINLQELGPGVARFKKRS